MATSENYENLPPSTTWDLGTVVHCIGMTCNKLCFVKYLDTGTGEKQPRIYVTDGSSSVGPLENSTVPPTHFIVDMKVYYKCVHILKRPKNCPVGTHEETIDEVVVIKAVEEEEIFSISVPQKLKHEDTVTMAVGRARLFVLDTRNSRILGYSYNKQRKSITKLRGPLAYDSDMHLLSSGMDNIVFVEKNLVIYAVKVTGSAIMWKLNISAPGHFQCYHDVGIHLEEETRMVGIVNTSTGDFELRIRLYLRE